MPELHDLGTGKNTFCPSEKKVVEASADDDRVYEVTDGPETGDGLYEIADGAIKDATYEYVAVDVSLYDVPRRSSFQCDTFDNAAYNAVSFEKPAYINTNGMEAQAP